MEISGSAPPAAVRAALAGAAAAPSRGVAAALRYVSLDGVLLDAKAARAVCRALCGTLASIVTLKNCGLDDASAGAVAGLVRSHAARRDEAAWARGLRRGDALKTPGEGGLRALDLSGNKFGDQTADHLASAFAGDGRGREPNFAAPFRETRFLRARARS